MRVLLVDDDDEIAGPLTIGSGRQGFEVSRATNGAQALAAEETDLILLDLGLPDLDGLEVCRRLRERSTVPIIVISARSEEI
ncbi:MAG: response regulator, partial [Pseudonocardiaceae bacterium]